MLYEQKIKYMEYRESGTKVKGAGFVKLERWGEAWNVLLQISGLPAGCTGEKGVYLCGGRKEVLVGLISMDQGRGRLELQEDDARDPAEDGLRLAEAERIRIPIGPEKEVVGILKEMPAADSVKSLETKLESRESRIENWERPTESREGLPESWERPVESRDKMAENRESLTESREGLTENRKGRTEGWESRFAGEAEKKAGGADDPDTPAGAEDQKESWETRREPVREELREAPDVKIQRGDIKEPGQAILQEPSNGEGPTPENWGTAAGMKSREGITVEPGQAILQEPESWEKSSPEGREITAGTELRGGPRQMAEGDNLQDPAESSGQDRDPQVPETPMREQNSREDQNREMQSGDARSQRRPDREMQSVKSELSQRRPDREMQDARPEPSLQATSQENVADTENPQPYVFQAALQPDKWEQLRSIYPSVRPFGDDREYLRISPGDFVILKDRSYRLANNSFLLHGYFNYKHLILHRSARQGETLYFVGVPGNFYDKEKEVAILFGFESFECAREPAKEGDYGYYMMRVEL